MEIVASAFQVKPSDGEKAGAFVNFPYDRELVQRFREAFARARWRGEDGWFVPGTTAEKRVNAWMGQELDKLDRHADARGRDAYLFEPLESPYLSVGDDLRVRTPYSQTIVNALRSIPWARWNPDGKIWHVPFRSYEQLRRLWPVIEEAARRNEPEERRKRREKRNNPAGERQSIIQAERRRKRFPVPGDDLPPLDMPLATIAWGVVVFEDIESTPIHNAVDGSLYPHAAGHSGCYVWAHWRMPSLQEIYRTRPPGRDPEDPLLREVRGWWAPSREELQERARKLREIDRVQRSREVAQKTLSRP